MKIPAHFHSQLRRGGLIEATLATLLSLIAIAHALTFNARSAAAKGSSAPPGRAGANYCACCADQGTWFQLSREFSEHERKMLARLKFQTARLYLTPAGEEDWRGIAAAGVSQEEDYALSFTPAPGQWTLTFKTKRGASGSLILTLPTNAAEFGADTGKELTPRAPVTLYKELRLEGSARGAGIFARGNAPGTKYRLALQGEGNMCFSAGDYYRWNLRVSGPKASYTFHGLFAKPS